MRLVFLGTPEIAVPTLERIVADGHQLVAIFTQPDRPSGRGHKLQPPAVKLSALAHSIPVYQPTKIRTHEFRQFFASLAPDLAVVVAYGRILPDWILEIPSRGFINSHFSLLPAYRGAAPINWAIASGERTTGVSVMKIASELDAGDILLQRQVEIGQEETAPELAARLSRLSAEMISETLLKIDSLTPQPQDHSRATFAPVLKREDGQIDWQQMCASTISARVRGFQPWPGVFCTFHSTKLNIWKARPAVGSCQGIMPGTVVHIEKSAIFVACAGASLLQIEELQLEGRKRLSARDFLNGVRLAAGDRLG